MACDGSCVNCCAEPPVGDSARRASPGGAIPPPCAARAISRVVADCIDRLSFAKDAARWPGVGTQPRGIAFFPRAFAVLFLRLAVEAPARADADDEVGTEAASGFAARDPEGGVGAGFAARVPDGRVGVCKEDVAAAEFGARGGGGPMGPPAVDGPGSLAAPFAALILCATAAGTLWFRGAPGTAEPATPTRIIVAASPSAAAAIWGGKELIPSSWEVVMLYSTLACNINTASCEGFGTPARNFASYSSALRAAASRDAAVAVQPTHKQWHLQMLHRHASFTSFVSGRLEFHLGVHTGQLAQSSKAHLHLNLWRLVLVLPAFVTFPCVHLGHNSVTSAPFTVKLSRTVFASFESALNLVSTSFCAFTFLFTSVLSRLFAVAAAVASSRLDFAAFRSASSFTLSRSPLAWANKPRAFCSSISAFARSWTPLASSATRLSASHSCPSSLAAASNRATVSFASVSRFARSRTRRRRDSTSTCTGSLGPAPSSARFWVAGSGSATFSWPTPSFSPLAAAIVAEAETRAGADWLLNNEISGRRIEKKPGDFRLGDGVSRNFNGIIIGKVRISS